MEMAMDSELAYMVAAMTARMQILEGHLRTVLGDLQALKTVFYEAMEDLNA